MFIFVTSWIYDLDAKPGFIFLKYNLTIPYRQTNLLARYAGLQMKMEVLLESRGYKESYRVDVDIPDGNWAEAPRFHDILIFNTGPWWWAPSKFDPANHTCFSSKLGSLCFPRRIPADGFDMVLEHMIPYVENKMQPSGIQVFRTQSHRHFEGCDWYESGSCPREKPLGPEQVEGFFSLNNSGTNMEAKWLTSKPALVQSPQRIHLMPIQQLLVVRSTMTACTAALVLAWSYRFME